MKKRLVAMVLVLSIILALPVMTRAEENTSEDDRSLGSLRDITGYFLPDIAPCADQTIFDGGTSYSLLFPIRANEVYDLLTSYNGGKSFTVSSLPSGTTKLYISGRIYVANISSSAIKSNPLSIGICYLDLWGGEFESVYKIRGYSGDVLTATISTSSLSSTARYYTFIKNESSNSTYLYGDVGLYYA